MEKQKRLFELDVLKGIMIFAIVFYHMPEYLRGWQSGLSFFYTYGGDIGNTVFFALSGFTVCYAYKDRVNDMNLSSFVFRRIKSVYPIYLLTEIISVYLSVRENGWSFINLKAVVLNLTMTTTGWVENIYPYNGPTWFFSALLIDYIVWFLITKHKKENKWYYYLGMMFLGLVIEKRSLEIPFAFYHTGEALVPFFEGCFLYKIWETRSIQAKFNRVILGVSFLLTVLILILSSKSDFNTASGEWKYVWYFACCPLIVLGSLSIKWLVAILHSKPARAIFGNTSKYMFFWHSPMYRIVGGKIDNLFPESRNVRCFCYLMCLYIVCIVSSIVENRIKEVYGRHKCH